MGGGGGGAQSGFRRKKTTGRLTGQAHLSVRGRRQGRMGWNGRGERWAVAGPKGGGREVGHDWVENWKWLDKILSYFYLEFGCLANFGNLQKEIPKEF
jgi:hypothetical protein